MLSILTPTIRGREALLERCKESLSCLDVEYEHLVELDDPPSGGPSAAVHRANMRAKYPWRFILCDDDQALAGLGEVARFADASDYDFLIGYQGQVAGDNIRWECTWPDPGATGSFMWHERMNAVAELPAESYFAGRTDQAGGDYLLLQRWCASGARWAKLSIRMLVHRVG